MPITQERMKQVLDAAQAIADQYILFSEQIAGALRRHNRGEMELPAMLEEIRTLTFRPEDTIARELIKLGTEQAHYRFSHNKNEQERRRLAKRRAGEPPAPRATRKKKPAPYADPPTEKPKARPTGPDPNDWLGGVELGGDLAGAESGTAIEDYKPSTPKDTSKAEEYVRELEAKQAWDAANPSPSPPVKDDPPAKDGEGNGER